MWMSAEMLRQIAVILQDRIIACHLPLQHTKLTSTVDSSIWYYFQSFQSFLSDFPK